MARTEQEKLREVAARERLRDRKEEESRRACDKREAAEARERLRTSNAALAAVVDALDEAFLNLLPGSTVSVRVASTGSAYITVEPAPSYQTGGFMQPFVDVHGCHIRVSDHPPGPKADADWYVSAGPGGFGLHWSVVAAHYACVMRYTNAVDGLTAAQPWLTNLPNDDAVYDHLVRGVARQIDIRRAQIKRLLLARRQHAAEIKEMIVEARHLYAFGRDLIRRAYVWDDGEGFDRSFYNERGGVDTPKWRVLANYYIADITLLRSDE